jgi:hypothetical protein
MANQRGNLKGNPRGNLMANQWGNLKGILRANLKGSLKGSQKEVQMAKLQLLAKASQELKEGLGLQERHLQQRWFGLEQQSSMLILLLLESRLVR